MNFICIYSLFDRICDKGDYIIFDFIVHLFVKYKPKHNDRTLNAY